MIFTVYILRTSKDTLYIGQTNNLEKRLKEHEFSKKRRAKYISYFSSFSLVYTEIFLTRSKAMKRESQLKKLPRPKKDELISTYK